MRRTKFTDYRFPYLDEDYVAVSLEDVRQRNLLKLFAKICDDPKLSGPLKTRIRKLDKIAESRRENGKAKYQESKNNTETDEEFDDEDIHSL